MSKVGSDVVNLDRILVEEVGQWGRYQLRALLLCGLVAMMAGSIPYAYLFTFAKIKTRCAIPECENNSASAFSPPWLHAAVPTAGDAFEQCRRFSTISILSPNTSDSCPANLFDRNSLTKCEEYVYEHKNSAYFEFNLACDNWRPTLVGSVKFLGMMMSLPIMGFVSDRWGRRITLTLTAFSNACIGCMLYFIGSYISYILLSFAESLFGSTSYSCAYILAVEYVGPKHRVITGVFMASCLATGELITGLVAWPEPYWRHLLLIIYIPQLAFVIYFWIAPESVRWLMSKGRYEESLTILKKAAEMNESALSEITLKGFSDVKEFKKKEKDISEPWLVCLVFRHKAILLRCLVTPFWWITCIMMYYGLTISSVGISGNKYLNYTASTAVQIPGYWIAFLLLDRLGRKALVLTGFWISGACQFAYIFIPDGHYWLSLSVFLVGKMCISSVMTTLYVYTAELYPTRHRTSLFAYSSMIGRVGGILAPLMPGLAADVWQQLPFALFGGLALLAGLLALLAPETLGTTLPDSMEDAARLGSDTPTALHCLRKLMFRSKSYTIRKPV